MSELLKLLVCLVLLALLGICAYRLIEWARSADTAQAAAEKAAARRSPYHIEDSYNEVRVWFDPVTNCQYLHGRTFNTTFFVERRRYDKQVCGGPE